MSFSAARTSLLPGSRTPWTGAALALAIGGATLGAAALILLGGGSIATGLFVLAVIYVFVLSRWQRGFDLLLLYLPVAGVVTLLLSPWRGPAAFEPVVFKDWLFALPAYLGFVGAIVLRRERFPKLGLPVAFLIGALASLVFLQMINPGVQDSFMALVGAKVWLFYLPLYALSMAALAGREDLTRLLRLLLVIAVLPCAVGIAEYLLSQSFGYARVMQAIYGAAAPDVTQGFVAWDIGGGLLARIPSTFTFVTQYFGFTLAMIPPAYAVWRSDGSRHWRRAGKWVLVLSAVAGFVSGSRAAFAFVPLMLVLLYGLDRGFRGVLRAAAGTAMALAIALGIALGIMRLGPLALFHQVSNLLFSYAENTAYAGLAQAIAEAPLGNGTGTNTGSARYALNRPEFFTGIENYYAKASYELGIPGLIVVVALFIVLIVQGLRARSRLRDPALRAVNTALTAFLIVIALSSFKGWLLDLDPINVYFWVFAGALAKLPELDPPAEPSSAAIEPEAA